VANLLAGAPADAPAVELTLGGAELMAIETCLVALGGADLGAERDDGTPLPAGAAHRLPAGGRLRLAGGTPGFRAYLALAGGIDAERVLGSASTHAPGRLGRDGGRALQAGDRLVPCRRGDLHRVGLAWPAVLAPHPMTAGGPLGIVPGPDLAALPLGALDAFVATGWHADRAIDRMGIRLAGPPLASGAEILSHPLLPGAVQVPRDGRPIVALVDGPTIGGYPVIGVVPRADVPRLGQVRPGDPLAFAVEAADHARERWRAQQALLARATAALGLDAGSHPPTDPAAG
jgi:biotin-dependent carboxylase-like uncharacterized protein